MKRGMEVGITMFFFFYVDVANFRTAEKIK